MKIASVADIKARLSAYLKASATGPVVVTRNGKAVAVLVGVEDDEEVERLLLAHSRKLRTILDAAIAASTKARASATRNSGAALRRADVRIVTAENGQPGDEKTKKEVTGIFPLGFV